MDYNLKVVPIIEKGLRSGEKLNEELLSSNEELITTPNHKIYIEHQIFISKQDINKNFNMIKGFKDKIFI